MIVNCPECGTHFKHEMQPAQGRGRCGRCNASIDLSRLRTYRLAPSMGDARVAAPVGASMSAATVAPPRIETRPAGISSADWETEDPLPPIPEMASREAYETPMPAFGDAPPSAAAPVDEALPDVITGPAPRDGSGTTFVLWLAAGAIVGTGTSWTLGGTTLVGISYGALAGALIGLGWRRWTSPR